MSQHIDLSMLQDYPDISIADLDDILHGHLSPNGESGGLTDLSNIPTTEYKDQNDRYRRSGTFADVDMIQAFYRKVMDESFRNAGVGGSENMLQNFVSRLDRHGTVLPPINTLNYGYTFITRPRLNLTQGNIRQHVLTSSLYTIEKNSIPFLIRALLDTRLCSGQPIFRGKYGNSYPDAEATQFHELAANSDLFDIYNPFLVPLCNGLKGISGFPDFTIQEETTEGDFHSGDFTFVKGSDMNNKTTELSLEFRDVQGSIILSTIYLWCLVMALQAKGVMMAYQDDIYEQRLNYTVSIYRFVTDPTRRNILWWAKATGCFPKSAPVGALFNINQGETIISSAMNFSVPFVANDIKYNEPGILIDFNRLMRRYAPGIEKENEGVYYNIDNNNTLATNFQALPYIRDTDRGIELQWITSDRYKDASSIPENWDIVEGTLERMQEIYLNEARSLIPSRQNPGTTRETDQDTRNPELTPV